MALDPPEPNVAPRASKSEVGHFVRDVSYDGLAHYCAAYRTAMAELPAPDESFDVTTDFGSVRVYRFDGPAGTPVVLLPGRNAATPMWAANLPGILAHRTVYAVDLLGEPGFSVQHRPLSDSDDQASWFDDMLAGVGLDRVHVLGLSFGGWSAMNHAILRPGRTASVLLLDPVMTFARIPIRTILLLGAMVSPAMPEGLRRRVLRWLSGGADVDDSVPVAALIAAGTVDFVLRQPMPKRFSDEQLSALDVPVLAILAGRSVIHNATEAANRARKVLRHGRVEMWPEASHAINGEYPDRITATAAGFWNDVDAVPPV